MDISFLTNYIDIVCLGICLCVGYVIKKSLDFIPNKYIPLIMLVLGCAITVAANGFSATNVLSGMCSGLASTGLYEALRNFLEKGEK